MNPYLPDSDFPNSVWFGTSHNKPNGFENVDPGYRDYNQACAEVIAVQDYLTTPFIWADFQTGNVNPSHSEGRVFYDDDEKTFAVYNNEPDVTLSLGQEIYIRATNKTGVEIANGAVCFIDGAQGNRPTVALAKSDSPSTSEILGVATHNVDDNATGFFTVVGLVRGLDTSSYNEGDTIFVSDSTAGDFTDVAPTAPSFPLKIGVVTRSNADDGAILVTPAPTDVVRAMVIQSLTVNETFRLYNTAWDDLRIPVNSVRVPATNNPDWEAYKGGLLLAFGDQAVEGNEEIIYFTAQMPHAWKEGTDLKAHIHWTVDSATIADVAWKLSYSWANIGDAYPTETEVVVIDSTTGSGDSLVAGFAALDGTGKTLSSTLICSLKRNSSNVLDTLTGVDALLTEVDFHYEINKVGSDNEFSNDA